MQQPVELERAILYFQPVGRGWRATRNGDGVFLCNQPFCEFCNSEERKKLERLQGGRIEVALFPYRRPSLWKEERFYVGHVVNVLSEDGEGADEGLEFDSSKLNAILFRAKDGSLFLIDPGSMGFDETSAGIDQLIINKIILLTLITHGHLDHVIHLGKVKEGMVFLSKTTLELISRHASWQRNIGLVSALRRAEIVGPGEPILAGNIPFNIQTFPLCHTIPETMGVIVEGARGRAVVLSDFRLSGMDARGRAETISHLQRVAEKPVDYLAMTITNAHLPGFTPIEGLAVDAITNIMTQASGRVLVACFASNFDRIRELYGMARLLDRPVQFFGAGMQNAREILSLQETEGDLEKAVVFVTGCQAEEKSVLWRIVHGERPPLRLSKTDTVVFSARCIPGNEEDRRSLHLGLQQIVKKQIINDGDLDQIGGLDGLGIEEAPVHFSGHEYGGGLRLVLKTVRPGSVLVWPQTEPQISAFRAIVKSVEEELGIQIEILPEGNRIIDI